MGYSENLLPKFLAKLGADVHVVTSTAQVYFNQSIYKRSYEKSLGPAIVETGIKKIDGYTLHRLPLWETGKWSMPGITGLKEYLVKLDPDIIQTFENATATTMEAAEYAKEYNRPLFTECHIHASVLYKKNRWGFRRKRLTQLIGNMISRKLKLENDVIERCYAIAPDAAEIAHDFYRIPKHKIVTQSLGVDTDMFHPLHTEDDNKKIQEIRNRLGFSPNDIVCVYSGRLNGGKNPHCLARAIDRLQELGKPYRGLFIGEGDNTYVDLIRSCRGCIVHPFVKVSQLPELYRASNIGVWPREESTSQLDAMSCGLPIVVSDQVKAKERVEGNGLTYRENDPEDLADTLLRLKDPEIRKAMGQIGAERVSARFSWTSIAKKRLEDYSVALKKLNR